jgi:hypothetical protein
MGIPRSGSSWVYLACHRLLILAYGEDMILDVRRVHGYLDPEHLPAFATYRDFRDSLISNARAYGRHFSQGIEQDFMRMYQESVRDRHEYQVSECRLDSRINLIKYEDYFPDNTLSLIHVLAEGLDLRVPTDLLVDIVEDLSLENIKSKTEKGPWSVFTAGPMHITNDGKPGAWKSMMTRKMVRRCKDRFTPMLVEWGYEKDDLWTEDFHGKEKNR